MAALEKEQIMAEEDRSYTVEDIYALPEGQRAELIDGKWYDMASPSRIHQALVMAISYRLREHILDKGGDCQVYPAPFAVFLNKDNKTYLEPDVSVICDPEKLDDRGCNGAPDLVVEITSPSSTSRDNMVKLLKYCTAGVKEYWVVNPAQRVVSLYSFQEKDLEKGGMEMYSFDQELHSVLFPEFSLRLSEEL